MVIRSDTLGGGVRSSRPQRIRVNGDVGSDADRLIAGLTMA